MVIPPMVLLWLQRNVLRNKSAMVTNLVNIGLVAATSFGVLPFLGIRGVPTSRVSSGRLIGARVTG